MKLTKTGFRITRNGNVLTNIEKDAIQKDKHLGQVIKEDGEYYFFNRKQGNIFIYLP